MKRVRLGRTGLEVSPIGFGGLQIASRMEYPAAEKLLNAALDAGINILDTARNYQDSEARIGRAISHRREEFHIATKGVNQRAEDFWRSLEDSLRDLQTDYIDIYQFHGAGIERSDFIFEGERVMECMLKAKEQGKIRFIGFSSHSPDATLELIRTGAFDIVQYPISYVGSEAAERGLVDEAARLDVGFLGMKPFGGGRLGSARYCLGYVFQFPTVVPLIGFESEAEMREAVSLTESGIELTPEDEAEMARIKAELGQKFCRGCCYCQPCPEGVKIWPVMFLDVFRRQFGEEWLAGPHYRADIASVRKCIECGLCAGRCPFGLEIPKILKEQVQKYEKMMEAREA